MINEARNNQAANHLNLLVSYEGTRRFSLTARHHLLTIPLLFSWTLHAEKLSTVHNYRSILLFFPNEVVKIMRKAAVK
jgi:hypothetical protein